MIIICILCFFISLHRKFISIMEIYHGGYCQIDKPEIIEGKYAKDFGQGFYCTELKDQAVRWSNRYRTSVVNIYSFELNEKLKILHFTEMTEDWLDFIVSCRSGVKHDYDMVMGAMANDQIFNYISDYINGILTREQFWVLAKFKHPTNQISFCTHEALNCLKFIRIEEVNK